MKRTVLIYALVLLVAVTAIVAMAQGQFSNPQVGCSASCQQALGLSQQQVAEMTSINTAFMNDTASLRADLQAKMKEISGLWALADPNLDKIKAAAGEADQIRAAIRNRAIDAHGAILKMLTPAQRATCVKQCQSGQCGCGMCGGFGMGMGICGMSGGNAAGTCPIGISKGTAKGCGGAGTGTCCPARK